MQAARLAGPIDTANCGSYACTLYISNAGIQLVVAGLGMHEIGWMTSGSVFELPVGSSAPLLRIRRVGDLDFVVQTT
jgi:hypothetical protein